MARGLRLNRDDGAQAIGAGRGLWLAAALLLAAPALLSGTAGATAIDWQPQRWSSEPWRLWSAAWVHYTPRHLAANLAGTALVAALGWVAALPPRATLAWLLAWPLTHLALAAGPAPAHYGGLSGVLHAGVAIAALWLWRGADARATPRRRAIGLALLAGAALKILLEAPWSAELPHSTGLGITVVPFAHAGGALAGLASGWLLLPSRRPGS